jgi:hypothetical protein
LTTSGCASLRQQRQDLYHSRMPASITVMER